MRVLVLAKSFPIFGGVERWLADLIVHLRYLGVDVRLGLAKGARFHLPDCFASAYPDLGDYVCVDGSGGGSSDRRCALEMVIRNVAPDVIVPALIADGLDQAAALRNELGFAIVYPIHELCSGVARDLVRYKAQIDHVVVVDGQSESYYAEQLAAFRSAVSRIPCGVLSGSEPDRDFATVGNCLRLGWVGRVQEPQKRAQDLILIAREVRNSGIPFNLRIVGVGAAERLLRSELAGEIEQGVVSFVGSLTREQLYSDLYPQVDVLLVTSDWETGPLVAFEAMMNGVAVVTADFLGRSENGCLMDDVNCLVFPVGDVRSAVGCLRRLLVEHGLMERLTRSALEYAQRERRIDVMAERWLDVLRETIASRAGSVIAGLSPDQVANTPTTVGPAARFKCAIKRLFGRRFIHAHAGEEWPSYSD